MFLSLFGGWVPMGSELDGFHVPGADRAAAGLKL